MKQTQRFREEFFMRVTNHQKASFCLAVAALAILLAAGQTRADGRNSATSQPAAKKADMGPPGPDQAVAVPPGHAPAQPAVPQPTVQLKPGEIPGISFDMPEYNFGRIPAGQEITHDFWFRNTGNGPLEIIKAQPS
jgi:hypothetical protein